MPEPFEPQDQMPAPVEAVVAQLGGTKMSRAIVRALSQADHPLSVREIRQALGTPPVGSQPYPLGYHLNALEDLEIISADIPPGQRRGRTVHYTVNWMMVETPWLNALTYMRGNDIESA